MLGKSTWAVLALTLDIELFTQLHYRQTIDPDDQLSELFKDVFRFHWMEEAQHAILDEIEWVRHDAGVTDIERDKAVDEFIELVTAVDGIMQAQATADTRYFAATCERAVGANEAMAIEARIPRSLPLAIHPLGRRPPPFRQRAHQPDYRRPG